MREYNEFDNWASNIVNSAIFEAGEKTPIKRGIPQSQDIVYQAKRKYPDRDTDAALSLFLADKLEDFDRRDLDQNAVINAQRKENAKLNQNVSKLQQELQQIETSSENTDAEIDRLKKLSGKLTTDIEQRGVSARDIEKALEQVEQLRNKPGMSEEKYEELKKKIEDAQQNGDRINPEEFKKFASQIAALNTQQSIEKDQLSRLGQIASKLETEREELASARGDLETRISNLERREAELPKTIEKEVEKETAHLKKRQSEYRKAVKSRSKQANTLIKNFLNDTLPGIELEINFLGKKIADIESELSTQIPGPKSKFYAQPDDFTSFMSKVLDGKPQQQNTGKAELMTTDKPTLKNQNIALDEDINYVRNLLNLKYDLEELKRESDENRFRVLNAGTIWWKNYMTPDQKRYLEKYYLEDDLYLKVLTLLFYKYAKYVDFDEIRLNNLARDNPETVYKYLLKFMKQYAPDPKTEVPPSEYQLSLDFKESINNMVDNIIGEQVARWIK